MFLVGQGRWFQHRTHYLRRTSISRPSGGTTAGRFPPSRPGEFHPEPLTDWLRVAKRPCAAGALHVDPGMLLHQIDGEHGPLIWNNGGLKRTKIALQ
jgi:hypothetical protein